MLAKLSVGGVRASSRDTIASSRRTAGLDARSSTRARVVRETGVVTVKGTVRKINEDTYLIPEPDADSPFDHTFAVFDGHGGSVR